MEGVPCDLNFQNKKFKKVIFIIKYCILKLHRSFRRNKFPALLIRYPIITKYPALLQALNFDPYLLYNRKQKGYQLAMGYQAHLNLNSSLSS